MRRALRFGLTILIGSTCMGVTLVGPTPVGPTAGHAADYFPLDDGIAREYFSLGPPPAMTSFVTQFGDSINLDAYAVKVLNHVGGWDDGLQQYWSKSADGSVLFHGYHATGSSLVWSPPFLMMALPLTVGKKWFSQSIDPNDQSPVLLNFEVVSMGSFTVPAGTFDAVTIQITEDVPTKSGRDVRGRIMGHDQRHLMSDAVTYGDDAGIIKWVSLDRTDTLLSVAPMAVEARTWSGVRQLYR